MARKLWKLGRPRALRPLTLAVLSAAFISVVGAAAACGDHSVTDVVPLPPSTTPTSTPFPSPIASHVAGSIASSSFISSGDPVSGWYWLRDEEYMQTAAWTFDSLPPSGDISLQCTALAAANGAGEDAHFYLSYGRAATSTEGPLFFGQIDARLHNEQSDIDPVDFCMGRIVIPRAELRGAQNLAIMVSRSDPSRGRAPIDAEVAFRAGSVVIVPAGTGTTDPGVGTQVSAAPFWSNGDPISGWYWLRDGAYQDAATWVVKDVPAGLTSVVVELQVLATNGVNGGRGYDGRFYLSWGALDGDTVTFGASKLVTLPNTAGADDPVGYQCSGWTSITLPAFGAERTLVLQIRRNDPGGSRPAVTRHIAVTDGSVSVLFGE